MLFHSANFFTWPTISSDWLHRFGLPQTNYPLTSAPAKKAHICAFHTFLLGPLFQLAKKEYDQMPWSLWKLPLVFPFSLTCVVGPQFTEAIFIHPPESFIFKLYNIWAMNSMFYGDILVWRQGFITSRLRLEIFMHNEGKQKFYKIQAILCSFWSIGWKSRFQIKISFFMWNDVEGGKRKFYNKQLVVQRSLACVEKGRCIFQYMVLSWYMVLPWW